jgi:hypothetical protein
VLNRLRLHVVQALAGGCSQSLYVTGPEREGRLLRGREAAPEALAVWSCVGRGDHSRPALTQHRRMFVHSMRAFRLHRANRCFVPTSKCSFGFLEEHRRAALCLQRNSELYNGYVYTAWSASFHVSVHYNIKKSNYVC